ncbi:LysR substrate-binding domain-containing protein [Filomicrobium sp.]|uniref:LysR substrate-binding domain-containing protein n=1 Tax=Filomicrobium sp. TaxID=2024831 RepID=UPI00258727D4|nr:LysR substrate-binding domain-containing protein [Filomicrobium sp.]MCV0367898.1 LysR family transcriptional regulator [Filomicrobium sp.]
MDLRQLKHFVAAAEEQHFTRAARRMNIVQSGLSASIRGLEEGLSTKLFFRNTRQVELTAAGQVLYEKAKVILAAAQDAREAVAAINGLQRGVLAIGTVQSLSAFIDLPELLGRFHAQHPSIEIKLCQSGMGTLMEKLQDGRVDLAFMPLVEPPKGITTELITCEALVIACPPSHPLAERRDVSLHELAREPFVDFQADWGTRRLIDRTFAEAGVLRQTAFEVSDLQVMLELVSRGLGVALLPEPIAIASAAEASGISIGYAELKEPEICWELVVAFAGNLHILAPKNPAAQAFLDLMSEARNAAETTV